MEWKWPPYIYVNQPIKGDTFDIQSINIAGKYNFAL